MSYALLLLLRGLVAKRKHLPSRPLGRLYNRSHSSLEEVSGFAEIDHVEDDSLPLLHVLHAEVEPEADARVARVRASEQVVPETLRYCQDTPREAV